MKYRTCKQCGWVHFAITLSDMVKSVKRFQKYFNTLSEELKQINYGGNCATLNDYSCCFVCKANWTEFRAYSKKNDIDISGHTLSPILYEGKTCK